MRMLTGIHVALLMETRILADVSRAGRLTARDTDAEVVKLVDTLRSGRSSRKGVGVRVPPSALSYKPLISGLRSLWHVVQ